jgi:alkylresorcinol/alkylpyrone synthase
MSRVISVGTAEVPYIFSQKDIKEYVYKLFSDNAHLIDRIIGVFDNSGIEYRHFAHLPEWFDKPRGFIERSDSFLKNSIALSKSAISDCLEECGAEYSDFDHIIFVSSTGVTTPTVDAHLVNELRLDRHIKRSPLWGLGCVGGATGLSRALEYTRAYPQSAVMVVCVELCSLAFQKEDYSKSNIVALALFSDGAAACLVAGSAHKLYAKSDINLLGSHSTTFDDTLDVMGWEIVENGFKAIFSKDIPTIVRDKVSPSVLDILRAHGLTPEDLKHFILHPGGPKVLKAYEESLGCAEEAFEDSRKVLSEHGNMSSPTVLYVLKEFIKKRDYKSGDYGIISALGPGFTSELLMLST